MALAAGALLLGASHAALAFDFFGLWPAAETPPAISQAAIPYRVTVEIVDGDKALAETVKDASSLYKLRQDAPPDGDSLARRAAGDFAGIVDALWGAGYYNAKPVISIDHAALTIGGGGAAGFARAAEAYRNRSAAPVAISVTPGPLFKLRAISISAPGGGPFQQADLPDRIIGLKPGDPAAANDLRAAQARIVDYFRAQGHPLAKLQSIIPTVDHAAGVMDIAMTVAPGPLTPFGEASFEGPKNFDPAIARSFLYLQPGDPYSPAALEQAKAGIREIPAVGGVKITEATQRDANGRLPYTITITDRLAHAFGVSAKYSTTDGPAAQVYWEDRNLLGGAERLRLEADLLYAPHSVGGGGRLQRFTLKDAGGRLSASFMKPALGGSRNDLLIDALAERVSTTTIGFTGYSVEDADLTLALRHRFSTSFSIQGGLQAQRGVAKDALGKVDYTLIGATVSALYDSTDSKLDPTRGVRLSALVAAFPRAFGSSLNLVQAKAKASVYYSLDADQRFIIAGRVGFGVLAGPALGEIPANWRFYAGGGGSVRGYAYNSLGPTAANGAVIGGRSLFEASAELRIRLTQTIGVVPFFDAGEAFNSSAPKFNRPLQMAAGLGLRYYTSIGPIRLDVAAPLNPRHGDKALAVYVSFGQSF